MARRRGAAGVALAGLVMVAVAAAGAVAGALVFPQPVPSLVASSPTDSAETMAVSPHVFDGARQVATTPQVTAAKVLRSRATGVVTRSDCSPGGVIRSGSVPFFVDGQPVIALALKAPLWRDLSRGDKGTDVSALQSELARLGHGVKVTGSYDVQTRTAVRQLVAGAGGQLAADAFLPQGSFLWLPSSEVTPTSCAVAVGDLVSAGQEIATLAGGLRGLLVAEPPGSAWIARYGDLTARIDESGRIDEPAFLAAVEAGPEYRFATESGGAMSLTVTVQLERPRATVVVPPSAVVVKGSGSGCVVSKGEVVAVEMVSSTLGKTLIEPAGTAPPITEVDVHPAPSTRCP